VAQATESVITRERFAQGKTYQEYIDSGIRNREQFDDNYSGLDISPEQQAALSELGAHSNGPDHMVIIGEDWCPDVYRGMPVGARIAEALGIEARIFERDQNKDMIAEYLKDGEFESIPVFIFYNAEHAELANFIERPDLANSQMGELQAVLGDMRPEAIAQRLGHEPSEEEIQQARAEGRERYLEWQKTSDTWANWRVATVDEVIDLLRGAV
jgi:thiol-disulfide isomerase/thioredoxin